MPSFLLCCCLVCGVRRLQAYPVIKGVCGERIWGSEEKRVLVLTMWGCDPRFGNTPPPPPPPSPCCGKSLARCVVLRTKARMVRVAFFVPPLPRHPLHSFVPQQPWIRPPPPPAASPRTKPPPRVAKRGLSLAFAPPSLLKRALRLTFVSPFPHPPTQSCPTSAHRARKEIKRGRARARRAIFAPSPFGVDQMHH